MKIYARWTYTFCQGTASPSRRKCMKILTLEKTNFDNLKKKPDFFRVQREATLSSSTNIRDWVLGQGWHGHWNRFYFIAFLFSNKIWKILFLNHWQSKSNEPSVLGRKPSHQWMIACTLKPAGTKARQRKTKSPPAQELSSARTSFVNPTSISSVLVERGWASLLMVVALATGSTFAVLSWNFYAHPFD